MNSETSTIPTSAGHLKDEAADMAAKAVQCTREHAAAPLCEAAHKAGEALRAACKETCATVTHHAEAATKTLKEQCQRTASWASANPFTAATLAFAAGIIVGRSACCAGDDDC